MEYWLETDATIFKMLNMDYGHCEECYPMARITEMERNSRKRLARCCEHYGKEPEERFGRQELDQRIFDSVSFHKAIYVKAGDRTD